MKTQAVFRPKQRKIGRSCQSLSVGAYIACNTYPHVRPSEPNCMHAWVRSMKRAPSILQQRSWWWVPTSQQRQCDNCVNVEPQQRVCAIDVTSKDCSGTRCRQQNDLSRTRGARTRTPIQLQPYEGYTNIGKGYKTAVCRGLPPQLLRCCIQSDETKRKSSPVEAHQPSVGPSLSSTNMYVCTLCTCDYITSILTLHM